MFNRALKAGEILAKVKGMASDRLTPRPPQHEISDDNIIGRLEALKQKLSELDDRCSRLQK